MDPLPTSASRGRRAHSFTLLTPANQYPSRLPGLVDGHVVKLVTPRVAPARFSELLFVLGPDGATTTPLPTDGQQGFAYVTEGTARIASGEVEATLGAGGYAYLPPGGETFTVHAVDGPAQVLWLLKPWQPFPGLEPPGAVVSSRDAVGFERVEPAGLERCELLDPADARHDFNMSLLRFAPGVTLGKVEVHDEEHGLVMMAGRGLYFLDGQQLEVQRGDFVYMAPHCPQAFVSFGDAPAEYLLYKDVYRL